jgi:hypothetical protein
MIRVLRMEPLTGVIVKPLSIEYIFWAL